MSGYAIIDNTGTTNPGYTGFGAVKDVWRCKDPEIIVHGPFETGKTLGNLHKLHMFLCKYPNARGLLVRKTYKDICSSGVVTYEQKVLPYPPKDPRCPVTRYGGEKPSWYDYPNGARLEVRGLDNISSVLSAEYDIIAVIQAEELTEDEWQKLTARATGRAGNAPYAQVIGDCNPSHDQHWILTRETVTRFQSKHEDNPTLFDQETGEMTEQGKKTMRILDALTGITYLRGRKGVWAAAEGQVHEFYSGLHMIYEADIDFSRFVQYFGAVDWGFKNPGVIQIWGIDGDGRAIRIRESYHTLKRISWWVERALTYWNEFPVDVWICDPAEPEHIEEFNLSGLNAIGGDNSVKIGLETVNEMLAVADDGKVRLQLMYNANDEIDGVLQDAKLPTCTEQEFPRYVYPTTKPNRDPDEQPIKRFDHGMNAMRYLAMHLTYGGSSLQGIGSQVGVMSGWV